jgi:hypothetical protein
LGKNENKSRLFQAWVKIKTNPAFIRLGSKQTWTKEKRNLKKEV